MQDTRAQKKRRIWLAAMQAGQTCYGRDDLVGAEKKFRQAVEIAPAAMEGWFNLATVMGLRGCAADAIVLLRRAQSIDASSVLIQRALTEAYDACGMHTEAVEACVRAVSIQSTADDWNRLGVLTRAAGEFERAEAAYAQALRLQPSHEYARVNMGTLLVLRGRYDEARSILCDVLRDCGGERARVEAQHALKLLDERDRIGDIMHEAFSVRDFEGVAALLGRIPSDFLACDPQVGPFLEQLCASGRDLVQTGTAAWAVPDDWPEIEAFFSQHLGASVDDYLAGVRSRTSDVDSANLSEWGRHAEAIRFRRSAAGSELWDHHPELALRHAHWSILNGVDDARYCPGLFKLQPNQVKTNLSEARAHPMHVVGTIRRFFGQLAEVRSGDARAMSVYLMILKTHCFIDGNGRAARYLLNAVLESGGGAPVVFADSMAKEWMQVQRLIYRSSDITPFLEQLDRARAFTQGFLAELAARRAADGGVCQ